MNNGQYTLEESQSKRDQILQAAYQVFSRKGYHRATVDEIIALADTGKGTVYNYFVNKEQLFYTLIQEKSEPFESALADLVQSDQPPLVKVEGAIGLFLRFYTIHADLWRVMMHEMRGFGTEGTSHLKPAQQEKYRDTFRRTITMVETILREGIQQGVLRDCDAAKAALALFSVIISLVFQKMVDEDLDMTTKSIADVFLFGVAQSGCNVS